MKNILNTMQENGKTILANRTVRNVVKVGYATLFAGTALEFTRLAVSSLQKGGKQAFAEAAASAFMAILPAAAAGFSLSGISRKPKSDMRPVA